MAGGGPGGRTYSNNIPTVIVVRSKRLASEKRVDTVVKCYPVDSLFLHRYSHPRNDGSISLSLKGKDSAVRLNSSCGSRIGDAHKLETFRKLEMVSESNWDRFGNRHLSLHS